MLAVLAGTSGDLTRQPILPQIAAPDAARESLLFDLAIFHWNVTCRPLSYVDAISNCWSFCTPNGRGSRQADLTPCELSTSNFRNIDADLTMGKRSRQECYNKS
jgi:hypothetical protein